MKKLYVAIALQLALMGNILAQENIFRHAPSGYTYTNDVKKLPTQLVAGPSEETITSIVSGEHPKSGEMYIIAQNMPCNLNMQNSGEWTSYNGFKTWRLKVKSPGAEAIALLYSSFRIPESASVFVYNSSFTHKSRAYRNLENPGGDHFSTEIITGDEIILEYWVPETETELADIQIEALSHVFREGKQFMPKNAQQNGASDPCQVNVNCSEGSNWQDQKRGVAKIYVVDNGQGGLCTGSLINNTAGDCKNYFLTAQHCGGGATAANMNQWQFYFNFESSNCNDLTSAQANAVDNQVMTGCTKRASSGTSSNINHSDFLLVEFNSAIPAAFNVYYNGWDRNNTAATSGTSIHHPAGDIKKISTFSSTLQNTNWQGTPSGSHWRVTWVGTANGHGVTEGGSSGSPIFNQAKRIVGDLSGGSSYCNTTQPGGQNQPDLYGKFSYSWETAGANNNQRLRPWLDPNGTNPTTLDGKNACGTTPPPVGGCDTASNFNAQTHTASALTAPGGTGWLAGTNSYNDKAKAEYFANTFPANSQLEAFYMFFHTASGSGNVTFKVWDATGAGNSPGNILAQGNVPIANIPSNGNAILLDLSANPIAIPANGFYIGFDVPATGGTSVGLYTTAANQVATNTGWEMYSDNSWHSYLESYNNRYAHAAYAVVCSQSQSGAAPVTNFTANLTTIPAGSSVNFTQTCTNNPTTFAWTVNPSAGTSYQSGTTAASANPIIRFNNVGQYTISLTASNASGSDVETKTNYITVTSTGASISETEIGGIISIYPNPVSDNVTIELSNAPLNDVFITVIDMMGKSVGQYRLAAGTQFINIPTDALAQGIYTIELRSGIQRANYKIIKK